MEQAIKGQLVSLRPSTMEDRSMVFEWLCHSDLTRFMLGPPTFPDNPAPSWEEFIDDYAPYFFDGTQPRLGRSFIILLDGQPIGQVNHDRIYPKDRSTELDIWLSESKYTGKGYGTDALKILCEYLNREFGCKKFVIAPSRRNEWAIRSYEKAGFAETTQIPEGFSPDYDDAVVLVKTMKDTLA